MVCSRLMSDVPPASFVGRWTKARRNAVARAWATGALTSEDAARRWGFSEAELAQWARNAAHSEVQT